MVEKKKYIGQSCIDKIDIDILTLGRMAAEGGGDKFRNNVNQICQVLN